jgi:hypothetical protein
MLYPYFIFIVGCPASGKSTLAQMICQTFTMIEFVTDLNALKEIFLINDLAVECMMYEKSPQEVENTFSIIGTSFFWVDILETRIQQLKARSIGLEQLETIKTEDGGHRIRKPYLWDEVLCRSISTLNSNRCYVFEFSRGTDQAYMKEFNITPREVYHRCFSLILRNNPNITKDNSLIIRVSASHDKRERRNRLRKDRGERFVSQQSMDEVYKHDVFCFKENAQLAFPSGFLSYEFPVPVLSVDNTPQNPRHNFACIMEYLKLEVIL